MKTTRNFWRIVTLALALVMMFSVVACGNTEEPAATTEAAADGSTAAPTTEKPTTGTTAPTTEPTTGTTAPTTEPTTEGTTGGTDDPVVPPEDLTQPDVWDGTNDTSWFDKKDIKEEYTFTTAEQFAGFIYLRQTLRSENIFFEGVTIKLARDIILNEGTAEQVKELGTLGQAKQLEALHSEKALFMGTFDGQGHTISGAWLDCTSSGYKSLFGGIGDNAVIKNLKVTNSYFNGTEKDKYAGAIVVARAKGTNMLISNITVEGALLEESTAQFSAVGILVANLDDACELTIENCHTAGIINFPTMGTNGQGFGGIIGRVDSGKAEVVDETTGAVTTPLTYTKLTLKNCTSTAAITGTDYCGGLVGTVGDLATVTMDYKCKFMGTITCEGDIIVSETETRPAIKGEFVGSMPEFKPEQPIIIPELTGEDFSSLKFPEFDAPGTIVIEGPSCEAGSVSMTVEADKKYNLFNKDGNTGAAAHGIYKLAQGTNADGSNLFHYYVDFNNVNNKIAKEYGDEYKIAALEDCYIRWTFTVTEAGTYTFGSYMRLKKNDDRACQIQIDDNTPFIMHYTLTADEANDKYTGSVQDNTNNTQGSYLMWDGVEAELEVGEHTITYSIPAEAYRTSTSSWHWRTIYVMKKAA